MGAKEKTNNNKVFRQNPMKPTHTGLDNGKCG